MKFFLALVGTLLLGGVVRAQSTVSLNVAGNVSIALAGINATISTLNNTLLAADKIVLASYNNWANASIKNLTGLLNRFVNYSTLSLDSINNSITNLQQQLTYSPPFMLPSTDFSILNLFTTVYDTAAKTADTLSAAALNLTSYATCANSVSLTCLRKYGANLTAAPILMSRFNDCLSVENTRLAQIGLNMSIAINTSTAAAQNLFSLISLCNVPTAAALNSTNPYTTPSINCLTTFLSQIGTSNSVSYITMAVDSTRSYQTQVVNFRATRCAQLVQYDIQDTITRVNTAFSKCLSTGS
ncbi:uncharacterized protein LOC131436482 [Malaya genurostris]|uniref:uncharacterized protein LOC131436482 n=1 Tax=Malaya genurostris TaxID=325434 RepID=UPI0026F3D97E|nr:uncharacterized protein LOC131436482 [Malaya genurostris]